jgi:hypothetical protein
VTPTHHRATRLQLRLCGALAVLTGGAAALLREVQPMSDLATPDALAADALTRAIAISCLIVGAALLAAGERRKSSGPTN